MIFRLLDSYGWKLCVVILGVLVSSNCLFALMFKPLPKSRDDERIGCEKLGHSNSETLLPTETKKESLRETLVDMWSLMKNWAFVMFAISNFLTSLGYPIPYSFVPVSCRADQPPRLRQSTITIFRTTLSSSA